MQAMPRKFTSVQISVWVDVSRPPVAVLCGNDTKNTVVSTTLCLQINRKTHVACNFNCLIETEGLFKDTDSHVDGHGATHRRFYYRPLIANGLQNSRNSDDL